MARDYDYEPELYAYVIDDAWMSVNQGLVGISLSRRKQPFQAVSAFNDLSLPLYASFCYADKVRSYL